MLGIVQTAWLFTRGGDSVRILRIGHSAGAQRLLVHGPGTESQVHDLEDAADCTRYEAELERRLVRQGFRLERFAWGDRRHGDRRAAPRGADRRRHLNRVV